MIPLMLLSVSVCFNPHTYMRCDFFVAKTLDSLISFNPHTYMRCDRDFVGNFRQDLVSIHTPTWGVTEVWLCTRLVQNVSIHTPTWGVTLTLRMLLMLIRFQSTHLHEVWLLLLLIILLPACFNPHTYMRCDLDDEAEAGAGIVSIHTPTWGVTTETFGYNRPWYVSIHTPTWGVTMQSSSNQSYNEVSIHTPTWGVTVLVCVYRLVCRGFNPHTYMRCDFFSCFCCFSHSVSIHTPTWGVTACLPFLYVGQKVSIHTPTWGVTMKMSDIKLPMMFQSTHLHEVWHQRCNPTS